MTAFAGFAAELPGLGRAAAATLVVDISEHICQMLDGPGRREPSLKTPKNSGDPRAVAADLARQVAGWLQRCDGTQLHRQVQIRVLSAFIEQHVDVALTVRVLARVARLSEGHLARLFKRHTGLTVHAYVTRARMQKAVLLLEQGWKIEAVLLSVGYRNKTAFYRAFTRHIGCLPGVYRAKHDTTAAAPD